MRTEMHDASVYNVRLVSARKVVFTIDLNENPELRDPDLIDRSMMGFMLAYPKVESWDAAIVGYWLILTVVGTANVNITDIYT